MSVMSRTIMVEMDVCRTVLFLFYVDFMFIIRIFYYFHGFSFSRLSLYCG